MKIENIFTLSFSQSDVYISNRLTINETSGAITIVPEGLVNNDPCSDYLSIEGHLGLLQYPIKCVKVSNNLSSNYTTGKIFYYDADKNLLGKISFTRNTNIILPVSNAIYIAFKLIGARTITSITSKEFCEISTVINPHYKSLSKQYKKENSQMFFRESIEGSIKLFGEDYYKINNASLEDILSFNVFQNGNLFASNIFNKTDCKFNHFKKSVELKLTPRDKYTKVLDSYNKTFDLIKLAVGKSSVKLTKRSVLQIYIQGEKTITNYAGGTYWEDEVSEQVDSQSLLQNKYYFAQGPSFKEINLSGFNYPSLNTTYRCLDNKDCWNGNLSNIITGSGSIKFTRVFKADDYAGTSYSLGYELATGAGNKIIMQETSPDSGQFKFIYDMYRIDIFSSANGAGTLLYSSEYIYAKTKSEFSITAGASLYKMKKTDAQLVIAPLPAEFYLGANVIEYKIWGRLLCDVDQDSEGHTLYNLPYDDFATERANYKKCIGLTFTQSGNSLVHFKQSDDTQSEPTPWGINDYFEYFKAPIFYSKLSYSLFAYPLAKSSWANTSLWVAFEDNTSASTLSLENWQKKYYKTIFNRDCMEIGAIIKAILNKIDPSIKFNSTSEFSEFLYGTSVSDSYGKANIKAYLTQKSNILKGEYDQAAQKSEITFEKLMNLLRDCFKCYWFIDSENRFRIEHVRYFMNGMSHDSPTIQYDLVNTHDKFNKKPVLYCQEEVSFAKSELASRYEFEWADNTTEVIGSGFSVDVDSNYIQKDSIENVNVEIATSDVDMMMFAPNKFSQDGFALLMAKEGEVPIIYDEIYDERNTSAPIRSYTQNYYASFISLFNNYLYDMPAANIHSSVDRYNNISSERYEVKGIKRCMEHNVEFQTANSPDTYKLIGTEIGNGYVDSVSVNIDTNLAKVTLLYSPL